MAVFTRCGIKEDVTDDRFKTMSRQGSFMLGIEQFIRLQTPQPPLGETPCCLAADFDAAYFNPAFFDAYDIHCPDNIARAANKRQAEYFAGRWLAAKVMENFGIRNFKLSADTRGCPQWPEGLLGSLSHGDDHVQCCVGERKHFRAIGIDVQALITEDAARKLQMRILSSAERDLLAQSELPLNTAVAMSFSAKESIYKAIYPIVRRYFGYRSAELIAIDEAQQSLRFRLDAELTELPGCPAEVSLSYHCQPERLRTNLLLKTGI